MKQITDDDLHLIDGVINKLRLILKLPAIVLELEEHPDNRYLGSYSVFDGVVHVNAKLWSSFKAAVNETDKLISFGLFVSSLAHEMRHCYQSLYESKQYSIDMLAELNYYNDFGSIDPRTYHNLPSEIDAKAFQALIEERLFSVYLPISTDVDEEIFLKRLNELKNEYWDKIVSEFKPLYL